jgi:hypothetical protein
MRLRAKHAPNLRPENFVVFQVVGADADFVSYS